MWVGLWEPPACCPRRCRRPAICSAVALPPVTFLASPGRPPTRAQVNGNLTVTLRLDCPWLAVVDAGRAGAAIQLSVAHPNGTVWNKWINLTDTGAHGAALRAGIRTRLGSAEGGPGWVGLGWTGF